MYTSVNIILTGMGPDTRCSLLTSAINRRGIVAKDCRIFTDPLQIALSRKMEQTRMSLVDNMALPIAKISRESPLIYIFMH